MNYLPCVTKCIHILRWGGPREKPYSKVMTILPQTVQRVVVVIFLGSLKLYPIFNLTGKPRLWGWVHTATRASWF